MVRGFIIAAFLMMVLGVPPIIAFFLGACVWVNVYQKKKGRR
jgi:hypothetical protein